jgi:hypothetical protein
MQFTQGGKNVVRPVVQKVADERVRMLSLEAMSYERVGRKVPQIYGHNDTCVAVDGGGEHVAIVGIGRDKLVKHRLVATDESIVDVFVHQPARALELREGEIGTVAQQRRDPFFVNAVRPASLKKVTQGQMHQEVSKQRRIKNARIQKSDERKRSAHSRPSCWS